MIVGLIELLQHNEKLLIWFNKIVCVCVQIDIFLLSDVMIFLFIMTTLYGKYPIRLQRVSGCHRCYCLLNFILVLNI